MVFQNHPINPLASIRNLELKIIEHNQVYATSGDTCSKEFHRWSPPPEGSIKLNVDAAWNAQEASVAVVA